MSDFDDFSYEDDLHEYRDAQSIVRPSVTSTLKTAKIVDYSMVPPELLEAKRVLGQNVHRWTAAHDEANHPDPMIITAREWGYCQSWLNFKKDFQPKFLAIEKPMLRPIEGLWVGGTPDAIALIRNRMWIIDKKCCASIMPAWELQVADYELMYTQQRQLGLCGRMSVRLGPDGKYTPVVYSDPQAGTVAKAALALTYDPTDKPAAKIIDAWKWNKKIYN